MNKKDLTLEVQRIFAEIMQRAPEHKIQPTLERVQYALSILGDPQLSYPVVHVTGTNGKTSTSRMIDSLISSLGIKTGRFTSPHLYRPNERISVAGEPISDEVFIEAYKDIVSHIDMTDKRSLEKQGPRMSFFELLVVMAYSYFAYAPVDAAIMEIGVGGLWDATNVVDSKVAVITPISLDHTQWLGTTIEEIAKQKAGIIKPGQIVIVGTQPEEAKAVIKAKAEEVGAVAYFFNQDMHVLDRVVVPGGQILRLQTPQFVYEDVFLPLHGEYQSENAVLALSAVEAFCGGRAIDGANVKVAFDTVSSPGRLEVVRTSPTVIVDAAHNPDGSRVLAKALEEVLPDASITGIFSAMGDKDVDGILSEMEAALEHLVLVQMPGERAMDIDELKQIADGIFGADRVHIARNLHDAVDIATTLSDENSEFMANSAVLSFGSVVLAGAIRQLFAE